MTLMAADALRFIGITPKVALLSHSNFGSQNVPEARKMADALRMIKQQDPELEVEGEMRADAAISDGLRHRLFPRSELKGMANLLIMPNLDAANISYNLLKMFADGVAVGPFVLGLRRPNHILSRSATVRRIVNVTAAAVVGVQRYEEEAAVAERADIQPRGVRNFHEA
jgi:malate dehydrogenase (oxaloacetate-decarboxylating)(NADP+)